ncbi:MAG: hypothetical protein KDK45_14005, partial [Leptospiraceae bacterium]|nr:hypothetical protein [Leptospiraceae bacterium]
MLICLYSLDKMASKNKTAQSNIYKDEKSKTNQTKAIYPNLVRLIFYIFIFYIIPNQFSILNTFLYFL